MTPPMIPSSVYFGREGRTRVLVSFLGLRVNCLSGVDTPRRGVLDFVPWVKEDNYRGVCEGPKFGRVRGDGGRTFQV